MNANPSELILKNAATDSTIPPAMTEPLSTSALDALPKLEQPAIPDVTQSLSAVPEGPVAPSALQPSPDVLSSSSAQTSTVTPELPRTTPPVPETAPSPTVTPAPLSENDPAKAEPSVTEEKSATEGTTKITPESGAAETTETSCLKGSLDLVVNDWKGQPIPRLKLKVEIKKKVVFKGATDAKGRIATIHGLDLGSIFEIRVKRENDGPKLKTDDAEGYKLAAIGKIEAEETYACMASPKIRFEFSTEPHAGAAGNADKQKISIAQSHNQIAATKPEITGNPNKSPVLTPARNANGLPVAIAQDGLRDWFNRNTLSRTAPPQASTDHERLKRLFDFADKQATWRYPQHTSADAYIKQMMAKTFVPPESKIREGYQNSAEQCNKYVKIALWYAGYGPAAAPIGSGIVPAREMGPHLLQAGFKDVTATLPDGRWAWPGDVIVYENKKKPDSAGHIDIRTYEGYISDFFGTYLPISKSRVTGIYRKYSDPLPAKRMRAFLMVIASREAKTIFLADGYEEAFRTLPATVGHPRDKFDSFDTHPFAGTGAKLGASGAYGITLPTWTGYSKKFLELDSDKNLFSPTIQDRIAVAIMEQTDNSLALVRSGEIEKAASILAKRRQWTSLPSGGESNGFTTSMMMDAYNKFLEKL
jgi:muramidase (phage lysozyme)